MATLPKNFDRMSYDEKAEFLADLLQSGETLGRASPRQQDASLLGPDEADDQPAPAPGSLQIALAPSEAPWYDPKESKYNRFFDQNFDDATRIGLKLGIDPTLLLGLSASESGWAQSSQAKTMNNPVGATPNGKDPLKYRSIPEAWDKFKRDHGSKVEGIGDDVEKFIAALQLDDQAKINDAKNVFTYGRYNQEGRTLPGSNKAEGDPDWRKKVRALTKEVRERLPHWIGNRNSREWTPYD